MAKKTDNKKPDTFKIESRLILLVLLVVSLFFNYYLFTRSNIQASADPTVIQDMGNKYKELLKTEKETDAQNDLIAWLKLDHNVISSDHFNNGFDGLNFDYCSGSRVYGEDSWENLKK